MTKIKTLAVLLLGICIGVAWPFFFASHVDTSWQRLLTKSESENFGVGYQDNVIFTDLPPPRIRNVTGKAKFLESIHPDQSTQLGYIVNIDMDALDMTKVPQRYKEPGKDLTVNGYTMKAAPIDSVYYAVQFDFELEDKDGFTLKN
jgi:hypothetical protein